jgi:hypothetical protein
MLCPCWYGVKELAVQDQGWCAAADIFRIQQGSSDGVDLGGRTVASTWYFPGPTFLDGHGTGRLYVDEAATPDQIRELEAIFQGNKQGSPLEVLASFIPTWLPTQTARIEVQEEGDTFTATVIGAGQVKSQRLKDEEGRPTTMQNAGLTSALQMGTIELANANGTRWSDPDLPRHFESKSGLVANLTWSGA